MSLITRPFKVLGIQQIAIGGLDKRKLQTLTQATVRMLTKTFAQWAWDHLRLK
jgi:hypothetical protein